MFFVASSVHIHQHGPNDRAGLGWARQELEMLEAGGAFWMECTTGLSLVGKAVDRLPSKPRAALGTHPPREEEEPRRSSNRGGVLCTCAVRADCAD
jgi:hypothetical protein